jgi:hypothetical protein
MEPTANGDISRVTKLDIRTEAFHRLRVGSPSVFLRRCMNSYALLGSVDASRLEVSRISSGRSESNPRDKTLLRPLSGLKSFCGRIWKNPPEAATAEQGRYVYHVQRKSILESLHRSINLSSALELTRKTSGETWSNTAGRANRECQKTLKSFL